MRRETNENKYLCIFQFLVLELWPMFLAHWMFPTQKVLTGTRFRSVALYLNVVQSPGGHTM